jgi:nucleoside permease NupC
MLILRFLAPLAGLFLAGLLVAWAVTRDRKYLRIAWRTALAALVLAVAFALLYVFERVLLL